MERRLSLPRPIMWGGYRDKQSGPQFDGHQRNCRCLWDAGWPLVVSYRFSSHHRVSSLCTSRLLGESSTI